MDRQDQAVSDAAVDRERPGLTALAYRMLGTLAEAEDAVQETYLRWYRLPPADRATIENPAAWVTRVLGRICLDVLGSARRRREQYVGPWLPEPLPAGSLGSTPVAGSAAGADPLDRVTLDESVGTALLLMLEAMTPAERVAFVLHDVFAVPFDEVAEIVGRSPAAVRQLATSARRRVRSGRARAFVTREEHDAVVRDFAAACVTGDVVALTAVLDPEVTLRSDGGGVVRAALNPIDGADKVARFLLGVMAKWRDRYHLGESNDGLCLVSNDAGRVRSVINVRVRDGRIVDVWTVLNPVKLAAWQRPVRDSGDGSGARKALHLGD